MDSIIPLGQKNTLAKYMILSGVDNRLPMLDKDLLPPEWSKFVTDVKLVKDLHTTNFDQLHAYLEQHELCANEVRLMRESNQDPLALVANHQMTPPHFNTYQSSYNNPSSTTVSTISIWINSSHSTLLIYLSIITTIQSFIRSTIAMAFLTAIASSRFPSTNNQLRTFFNPRNQATIQDGKFIVQQVQGRQRQNYSSTGYKSNVTSSGGNNASRQARVVKCYNYQRKGHMARQCTQLSDQGMHPRYKIKQWLAEAQEAGTIYWMRANSAFQQTRIPDGKGDTRTNNKSVTAELERYKERVKTFEQRLNIDLSSREKMIDSQMDDMIKEKLALKEQVDSLEQNLSKQIKEKESLLQTFTVFKNESKEKENKYMENEIDLEKKIKELDNIIFKVGQSAQTVHMLTKSQFFYDK
ncbi:hypothetical protein Tco_1503353 [Tanacetum coccineum]